MTKEMIMDLLRTLMKASGGWLLATHWAVSVGLTAQDWQALTGAVLVIGGLLYSWYSTYKYAKKEQ